jgi:hypothetical protein
MVRDDLETRVKKAVLRIEKTLAHMYTVVRDLSLKLCHIIRSRKDHYTFGDDDHYRS